MKKTILLITYLLLIGTQSFGITLQDFNQIANGLEEFPPMDNTDLIDPDYSSYHKKITPKKWMKFFNFWSQNSHIVSKEALLKTIKNVIQKSPYLNKDSFTLSVTADDQIVCWGTLHAAFHSLLRCLQQLKAEGLIDNNLKITRPNVKFIFMGNIIDRSAYNLETLMLVLTLIEQNPQQVLYLRSSHENNQNWQNYDLKRELNIRLNINDMRDPFVLLLNDLFSALPSKIFLQMPVERESYLAFNSLNTTKIDSLLKINPSIEAFFTHQSRSRIYQTTQGLNLLPPEKGIPTWLLFSSPTKFYQQLYNFYYDSFSIIEIGSKSLSSTVTTYRNDIRQKKLNFSQQTFHLISGQSLEKGQHPSMEWLDIAIACPLDLSESAKILGERLRAGIDLRIRKLNREGGIHNKLLRLYLEDDKHIPEITLKKIQSLQKDHPAKIILTPLGSEPTKALLPLASEHNLFVAFPYAGDMSLRRPSLRHIIHYRNSYEAEIRALIKHAKEKLLKQNFAIFYMNNDGGEALLKEAKKILKNEYNLPDKHILAVSYPEETINVQKAAELIQNFSPDTLLFLSSFDAAKALVNTLGAAFLKKVTLLGFSFVTDRFKDFLSGEKSSTSLGKGLDVVISRVMPDPKHDQNEIVQEYRQEIDRTYPGALYDVDSLEGYINASILIHILQKLEPPVTIEKIINQFNALKNDNIKGLQLTFDPTTRTLSKQVWIDR